MKCIRSRQLPEVIVIEPDVFRDDRGRLVVTYRADEYERSGVPARFVQANLSHSRRGVLRGLHYQIGRPQGKLISVVEGEVLDVAVDIRRGSPTLGRWVGVELSAEGSRQVYVPEGFAHGFCVTSDGAVVSYQCTDYYAPAQERGIRWNDPSLGIPWPVSEPVLSARDASLPLLGEVAQEDLPVYGGGP